MPIPTSDRLELEQTLMALGIRPTSYRALMLLQLTDVAWADGKIESAEVERIRKFAADRLHLTPQTAAVLDKWLQEPPSQSYLESARVRSVAHAVPAGELRNSRAASHRVVGAFEDERSRPVTVQRVRVAFQ
ncbi:MAG: hypothetical protein ABI488_22735 [Polyangiaceae bacterium]